MEFESFAPDSCFGVPINPFPPGFQWPSVQTMLEEVLCDLKDPLVQQYLLRSNPLLDAQALSDPSNYPHKFSSIFRCSTFRQLSGGFDTSIELIRLHVPTGSFENYTSGLAVEFSGASSSVMFPRKERFTKFVFNKTTRLRIKLALNVVGPGEHKTVEVAILKRNHGAFMFLSQLAFDQDLFLSAFKDRSDDDNGNDIAGDRGFDGNEGDNDNNKDGGSVDFSIITASLLRTIIGGMQLHNPNDVSTSNKVGHMFKSVISSYVNSNIMMAFPVFSEGQWDLFHDEAVCRRMQGWGIKDRLRRVPFPPMPTLLLDYSNNHNHPVSAQEVAVQQPSSILPLPLLLPNHLIFTPSILTTPSNPPIYLPHPDTISITTCTTNGAARIAPLPQPEKEQTEEEKKEHDRIRKAEKRKIQKRIAAQRCNDRKAAERKRNRMLQIKKQ